MTDKVKNPTRLDIKHLPRDKQRCLGSLRKALVASANYCKRYPKKLAVLKATLKFVYAWILEFEVAEAKRIAAAKAIAIAKAKAVVAKEEAELKAAEEALKAASGESSGS